MSLQLKKLGEVAQFIRGITYKPNDLVENFSDKSTVCMRTANVQAKLKQDDLLSIPLSFVKNESKLLIEGDLLVSTANSWNLVGKCCWVPKLEYSATAGGFISILRANEDLLTKRYLYYWFNSSNIQTLARNCGRQTTNISNMDLARCLEIEIPLPTIKKQYYITSILDKADILRQKRQQAINKLDQLLQATFIDMFGDPVSNPKGWDKQVLSELTSKIGSGSTPRGGDSAYKDEGISLIRSLNIHDGQFRYKNLAFIDDNQAEKLKNVTLESSDVLLNITGASVARCCIVPNNVLPARVNQHVAILRTNKKILPEFLMASLTSKPMKNKLLEIAGAGATREALTKIQLQNLELIVPSLELQNKFLLKVSKIKNLVDVNKKQLKAYEILFNSLQNQAFSGKL